MNFEYNLADTVETLVNHDKIFIIPIYQRLFVWEEPQIDKLLRDLYESWISNSKYPYYVGVITVKEEENNILEVVDGQQRLTFFTLFGAECLRNGSGEHWQKFVFKDKNQLRIRFQGRPEDEEDIRLLIQGDDSDILNQNMAQFHRCWQKFVSENFKDKQGEDICEYVEYVRQYASMLFSRLPDSYGPHDLNLHFEKMNSSGKQLAPLDLIKTKYFSTDLSAVEQWNNILSQSDGFLQNFSNIKNVIDITVPNEIEPVEEKKYLEKDIRPLLRPEVFVLHVLSIYLPNEKISLDPDNILQTFEDNEPNLKEPRKFTEAMGEYRDWIEKHIIEIDSDDVNNPIYCFSGESKKHDQTKYPLEKRMLIQFQAMLYVSSNDSQRWILEAYNEYKNQNSSKDLLKILRDQDCNRHQYSDHTQLDYGEIDRYWFWKLDYILWEKTMIDGKNCFINLLDLLNDEDKEKIKSENLYLSDDQFDAIQKYTFRKNRSIEHLHPQTSETEFGENNEGLHNFGNLAMISSSFNSSQGNDPIATKFGRVQDQITFRRLQSIKMLLMFKMADGKDSGWMSETAKLHETMMLRLLKSSYGIEA